jgi:hypothetical protein
MYVSYLVICFSSLHQSNISTLHLHLNTLVEEDLRIFFRIPADTGKTEEDPEDEDEEEEEEDAPKKKAVPRAPKHPRAKASSAGARTSGEASTKKEKTATPSGPRRYDSKKAERERIKMLASSGRGTRPTLPGAT